jgi:RNA polymerase sigma-70 factor (ECF subfamily)
MTAPDESGMVVQRDELERGFRLLSTEHRAVLVLHYYVGMPMPALASTLGIPLGTAQSRLGRALVALRTAIGTEPDDEPTPIPRGQTA